MKLPISQEHISRSILSAKNRQAANTVAFVVGVLLATKNSDVGFGAISAVIAGEAQNQINDIHHHEIEADKTGRKLMKKSGFNEKGMQSFFAKLQFPNDLGAIPAYLLTHPRSLNRQADIDNPYQQSNRQKLKSSDEYFLFRARI